MKTFLSVLFSIVVLFSTPVEAQEVRVLSEELTFNGAIGDAQRKSIILLNEGEKQKTFFLKNINGSIGSSQEMKICLGDTCFDAKRDLAKVKVTLQPGEVVTDLYLEFSLGIAETRGNFELVFVDESDIRNAWRVNANYRVENPDADSNGSDYEDISIRDIYPNPSNSIAQLDYSIKNPKISSKITINSFIGNPVAEYQLDPSRESLLINVSEFHPGVYFYTLFVDNQNIVTKKLVVNK